MSFGADTDVDVQGEGRLVSLRYTRLTLVQKRIPGARPVSSLWGCIPNEMVVDLWSLLDTLRSRCTPVISQRFPNDYRPATGKITHGFELQFAYIFTRVLSYIFFFISVAMHAYWLISNCAIGAVVIPLKLLLDDDEHNLIINELMPFNWNRLFYFWFY